MTRVSTLKILSPTDVRSTVTFKDVDGELADPPGVAVHWKNPADVVSSYTYLVDVEVVRDSVGVYHMDLLAASAGQWWVRWEGVDLVTEEDYFTVTTPRVP